MMPIVDLPETELFRAARDGDRGAWNRLTKNHYPAVLALTRRMLGRKVAIKILQDVSISSCPPRVFLVHLPGR